MSLSFDKCYQCNVKAEGDIGGTYNMHTLFFSIKLQYKEKKGGPLPEAKKKSAEVEESAEVEGSLLLIELLRCEIVAAAVERGFFCLCLAYVHPRVQGKKHLLRVRNCHECGRALCGSTKGTILLNT
jgi:hypothetical protein